jgi:hypothetical protein
MRQISEFIAVLACALFTGAAVYINLSNIRRGCSAEWKSLPLNSRQVIVEPQ